MVRPPRPPLNQDGLNTSASMAAAAASVMTARFTPRTRSAGSPIRRPTGTAAAAASSSENGNGTPQFWLRWLSMNALIPANDICASDTWPT